MPTLKIENFKCYRNASIDFGSLTVLVGANGAGKSSVVQSLLLMHEGILAGRNHKMPLNDIRSQNLGRASDIVYNNDVTRNIKMAWKTVKPETSSRIEFKTPDSDSMLDLDIVKLTRGINELSQNEFHFLSADRLGSTIAQPMHSSEFPFVGDKGQFCAQLLAETYAHKVMPERLRAENTSPFLLDQVNLYINDIFPGVEIVAKSSWEMQSAQIMIRNSVQSDFGLSTNVGYGISYLLPIIVTGLIASKNSIIIVENPEAHLHPAAQSQIGKFLAMVASTGTRVVVETHSDHLVNGIQYFAVCNNEFINSVVINNFSIAYNSNPKQGYVKINRIGLKEDGDFSSWPLGFMDQSKIDLYELIKARSMNMPNSKL